MSRSSFRIALCVVFVLGLCGGFLASRTVCSVEVAADTKTEYVFPYRTNEVISAITEAFSEGRFYGMNLWEAAKIPDMVPGSGATNGFVLQSHQAYTAVRLAGSETKAFPYNGWFSVQVNSQGMIGTHVVVRTIHSEANVGTRFDLHVGGAAHRFVEIPPVKKLEYEVLLAISEALHRSDPTMRGAGGSGTENLR